LQVISNVPKVAATSAETSENVTSKSPLTSPRRNSWPVACALKFSEPTNKIAKTMWQRLAAAITE
jgi:hypothetical protein